MENLAWLGLHDLMAWYEYLFKKQQWKKLHFYVV